MNIVMKRLSILPVLVILVVFFGIQPCKSVITSDEELDSVLRNKELTQAQAEEAFLYIRDNKKINDSSVVIPWLVVVANLRTRALYDLEKTSSVEDEERLILLNTLIRDFIAVIPEFDPNITYGSLQSTYLHEPNILKNESMVEQLLARGANPKICDQNGRNAFHEAIHLGAEKAVEILYEHDTSLLQIKTEEKQPQTPIELAQSTLKKLKEGKKPSRFRIESLQRIEAFLKEKATAGPAEKMITLLTALRQKLSALATALGG